MTAALSLSVRLRFFGSSVSAFYLTQPGSKSHLGFRTDARSKPGACNLIAALAQEGFAGHDLPAFGGLKGWGLRNAAKRLVNGSLGHLQAREAATLRYRTSWKDFVQVAQAAFAMKFLL